MNSSEHPQIFNQSMTQFQWPLWTQPIFRQTDVSEVRPQQSMGLVRFEGKIQRHSKAISLSLLPVGTHHCDHLPLHYSINQAWSMRWLAKIKRAHIYRWSGKDSPIGFRFPSHWESTHWRLTNAFLLCRRVWSSPVRPIGSCIPAA